MKLSAITLDCADPEALAAFYQRLTGFVPHPESDGDFAGLTGENGFFLGFQRVDGYRPPRWPGQDAPQQFHFDFEVDADDLGAAEALLREAGAVKAEYQPREDRWLVFTDPAGHPFCVIARRSTSSP
jgi:catechol 2,3-dioxygenase-like lactoylglutathione lyase family enzyme